MKNEASRAAWSLMFEALAKSYGADDPKRIAELIMEKHGAETVNEQTAAEIIADIFLAVKKEGKP